MERQAHWDTKCTDCSTHAQTDRQTERYQGQRYLHELPIHPWPDLIELAHNCMLGDVDGHLCKEDLATLPQQVLIRQPVPAVVHLLHLMTGEVNASQRLPE